MNYFFSFFILSFVAGFSAPAFAAVAHKTTTVIIFQFVEHPALNLEKEGVLNALSDAGFIVGKDLQIIELNAQGNLATATQIVQRVVNEKPQVVVTIATPAAQAMLPAARRHHIPMVFTAVTDPVKAKIIDSKKDPSCLITGVSDFIPAQSLLDLARKLFPNKKSLRMGIIYNPSEVNSATEVKEIEKQAETESITVILAAATKTSEVKAAAEQLVANNVHIILVPKDNTVASAINSVRTVSKSNRVPVITADVDLVGPPGLVAAAGVDRRALGKAAGAMVVKLLQGEKACNIPVHKYAEVMIKTSPTAAQALGIKLPKALVSPSKSAVGKGVPLGSPQAPHKIELFFAFDCAHCSEYNKEDMPAIEKFINSHSKQVCLIFYDLVVGTAGLAASKVARWRFWRPKDNISPEEHYLTTTKLLLAKQDSWNNEQYQTHLKEWALQLGLTNQEFTACLADQEYEKALLDGLVDTLQAKGVKKVPTFVVDQKPIEGMLTLEQLTDLVKP